MDWPAVTGKRWVWNGVLSPGFSVAVRTLISCRSPLGMPVTTSLTMRSGLAVPWSRARAAVSSNGASAMNAMSFGIGDSPGRSAQHASPALACEERRARRPAPLDLRQDDDLAAHGGLMRAADERVDAGAIGLELHPHDVAAVQDECLTQALDLGRVDAPLMPTKSMTTSSPSHDDLARRP